MNNSVCEKILKKVPTLLAERLVEQYKKDELNKILEGYTKKKCVTLRINTIKTTVKKVCDFLETENISFERVTWSSEALILADVCEQDIEKLDIYKNGEIYLQSLSSMLPPIILGPVENADILDMAAAPGGKTTQIAALTQNRAHITACEMNSVRVERLDYNLKKQGVTCTSVMRVDARNLEDFFAFDQILLDAPCSGSGTIILEENEENNLMFTEKFEQKLEKTQLKLLEKAIKLLKKGNEMVYSTCSILFKENESVILKILEKSNEIEIVPINFNGIEQIEKLPTKVPGTLLVAPNELYEGFFVAKLRKK